MKTCRVDLGSRGYNIYIDDSFANLGKVLAEFSKPSGAVIITDRNVAPLYGKACTDVLEDAGIEADIFEFDSGESSKNLRTVEDIYRFLASKTLDRDSLLIALGGGVVGDTVGFTAATFLRGIDFIQIPTTLLSQADSSVGGKTGVDFEGNKNIIGAFYQPRMVYINVNTLNTLPEREMRSGMAETLKHGLIYDSGFFDFLDVNMEAIYGHNTEKLMYVAERNCSIKASVVEKDERESGLRAILNFGHTFGHAIESASGFRLSHGECVAIGMTGAYLMAERMGMVGPDDVARVKNVIIKAGLPVAAVDIDPGKVYEHMLMDKKARGGKPNFILPTGIGSVRKVEISDKALIMSILGELIDTA